MGGIAAGLIEEDGPAPPTSEARRDTAHLDALCLRLQLSGWARLQAPCLSYLPGGDYSSAPTELSNLP